MIQIDIDADPILVDGEDRCVGQLPADPSHRCGRGAQARSTRAHGFRTASVGPAATAHPAITPKAHRMVPRAPGGLEEPADSLHTLRSGRRGRGFESRQPDRHKGS